MKYTLGIDLGSSSVKASILDVESGRCCGAAFSPRQEMAIHAPGEGMAEQNPADWYANARSAISVSMAQAGIDGAQIKAAAHMIKGAAANLCAAELKDVAYAIEMAGLNGDIALANTLVPQLDARWQDFLRHPKVREGLAA